MSIQDQVVKTRNYRRYILKDGVQSDRCRRCMQVSETIHHIIGGCQSVAQSMYKVRHDDVAMILHQELAIKTQLIQERKPYYQYEPENVLTNDEFELYWDRAILTDKHIEANRPDITLKNKKDKETLLIDIAIPNNVNLEETHKKKIDKYMDLCHEINQMWHMKKTRVIPIVISNMAIIPKNLLVALKELGVQPGLYEVMQKAVILNTCRIVRQFIQ